MKLMRLSPMAQRLRRVARAHAAGESTLGEYRQARQLLLAELQRVSPRKLDDTHRRAEVASMSARSGSEKGRVVNMVGAGSSGHGRSRRQLRGLVGALGVLVAALWALLRA